MPKTRRRSSRYPKRRRVQNTASDTTPPTSASPPTRFGHTSPVPGVRNQHWPNSPRTPTSFGSSSRFFESGWDFSSWQRIGALNPPQKRGFHSSIVIDDKMFIIGGDSKDQTFFSDMFAFDLTTQTWEECKAKLPSARTGHSCFYHHGYIYVLGGKNGSGYLNECLRCPLATLASWETFQSRGSTFQPRGAHASCIVQNRVFVFGGIRLKRRRDGSSFKYLQDLLCLDMNDRRWSRPTTYGTAPAARAGHTMTVVGQKLYVYGGRYQRAVLGDLYELDTRSMAWSKLRTSGDIPRVRAGHSMSYVFGHLVLWGGSDWNDFFSEIYVCDLTTGTWRRPEVQGKPPSGRFWQSCVVSKQGVCIYLVVVPQEICIMIFMLWMHEVLLSQGPGVLLCLRPHPPLSISRERW